MHSFKCLRRSVIAVAGLLLFMVAVGCSTTPRLPQQQSTVKNQASDQRQLGNSALRKNRIQDAELFYRNALQLSQSIDHAPGVVRSLLGVAAAAKRSGRLELAEVMITQAQTIAEREALDTLLARSYIQQAELFLRQDDPNSAVDILVLAERLSDKSSPEMALVLHTRGAALRRTGSYGDAAEALNNSIAIAENNKDTIAVASSLYQLASVYAVQNRYDQALQALFQSLERDHEMENAAGIGSTLEAVAAIYQRKEENRTAVVYYMRSYGVYQGIGDRGSLQRVAERLSTLTGQRVNEDGDKTIWEQLQDM